MDISCLTEAVLGRLFIELEASGRHVHVTREQAMALFGHALTPERPLSQPGQFLSRVMSRKKQVIPMLSALWG